MTSMGLFGGRKSSGPVIKEQTAGLHWDTADPFLFASHHYDLYPKGNELQAPPYEQVKGKDLGQDYHKLFGYRMYTGKVTPGFQLHSHWGYETITIASKGYVDHFDSLGNQGRYGNGDIQWITAGGRYHHCEMYPLVHQDKENPQLITQIMLNLPLDQKSSKPAVRTIWKENVPETTGNGWKATVIAGEFNGKKGIEPPKNSWAADPKHHVLILRIEMEANSSLELPPSKSVNRNIYTTTGPICIDDVPYLKETRLKMNPESSVVIRMGEIPSEIWILEGDPIDEKQISWGPVVLGSTKEVREANNTIRRNELEEWPWQYVNQKQPLGTGRFFRSADGTESRPSNIEDNGQADSFPSKTISAKPLL